MMYDVRTIWDSIGILIVSSSLNLLPQCICTTALSSFSKALFRVFDSSLIDITSDSCPYTPIFFFIPFLCLATVHTSTSPCYPAPQHNDSPLVFPFLSLFITFPFQRIWDFSEENGPDHGYAYGMDMVATAMGGMQVGWVHTPRRREKK